ncbi:LacI family DNA-binding transcriptional regulator [Marinoscillum sp. 108]|uniref:LacI family DNA-binding transcriptional regulator n=1 Tax=Marinoscillum luteum TaxID=861051 RepID=A0ABW7NED4_9BACT|nr:LacI family DNA-binding transcriptional regulator [Marinoscillum sp. 108]VXD19257.1 LacI family transcriptional regulator [Marinoscillum sp. 108]
MKKGSVTIKDIALELNISVSTVSRALADNPLVKPSTRAAVKELAKKYHYRPNFTALSLRSNKTKTLGIIIPQLVHEFFAMVIRGIEDFAYSNDYNVIICSTHESYEREVIDTKALINGRIDGLMACISKETNEFDHFSEFVDRGLPLVFFDCICDEIEAPKVVLDDFDAGYKAVKHLIDQGCTKIAYVGGPINLFINRDRLAGYNKALSEAGLNTRDSWIIHCDSGDYDDGMESTRELVQAREIDGLFAATDMLAIGAIKNMKAAGLKVPEDVAVVGFSNWSIGTLYEPSLSTMSQPGYEMGQKAAELLIQQIDNPDQEFNETVVLHSELLIRESSIRD